MFKVNIEKVLRFIESLLLFGAFMYGAIEVNSCGYQDISFAMSVLSLMYFIFAWYYSQTIIEYKEDTV
jgi:hypothetical protein